MLCWIINWTCWLVELQKRKNGKDEEINREENNDEGENDDVGRLEGKFGDF